VGYSNSIGNTGEILGLLVLQEVIFAQYTLITHIHRQRLYTQQIKEQDKSPPNQTKEEEIGNLPDKEF